MDDTQVKRFTAMGGTIVNRVLIVILLLLAGCVGTARYYTAMDSRFIKANYAAADSLVTASKLPLDKSAPILVATLVNIDNLEQTSTLGRSVSEQVATRLANLGYTVKEVKIGSTSLIKSDSEELLLSRALKDISIIHKAQAVVVGTYSDAKDYFYLNIKLMDAKNSTILSGYDYAIPANALNQALMGKKLNYR